MLSSSTGQCFTIIKQNFASHDNNGNKIVPIHDCPDNILRFSTCLAVPLLFSNVFINAGYVIENVVTVLSLIKAFSTFLCADFFQESSCNGCHHHAVCISSKCICRQGYSGDGTICRPSQYLNLNLLILCCEFVFSR